MEKSKNYHYDLSKIPESVLEELDRQQDGNNPRFNVDEFFEKNGILPTIETESQPTFANTDKFEQDSAKDVLKAMRLFGRKNRGIGLTRAIESNHQNIAGRYNSSDIDVIEKNEKHYFNEASVKIHRAIGSKAMNLIGFGIDANEATDELISDLPENIFKRYFVYENDADKKQKSKDRRDACKQLNEIAKQKSE